MLLSVLSGMAIIEEKTEFVEVDIQESTARTATNPLGWEWVTKDHDAGYVWTRSVETDSNQNTYIAGIFRGGSLSLDQEHALNAGGLDAFVAKFSTNGDVLWLTTFGGELNEHVEDMLVDGAGNVLVVGSYDSPQFNASTDILTNSGSRDGFAIQIDALNGAIDWGNSLSGSGFDNITGVTKDSSGYYAYSGWTASPSLTVNGTSLNNSGNTDFLVLWSYANGSWHQGRIYGGSGQEQAHDIVADQNGEVMVVAEFSSSSLTLDQTSINHGGGTGSDSLVLRVAHAGVEWVRKPICNVNDRAWKVDVDSAGNVFVVGEVMANTSYHSITWGSIQINSGHDYESVYVVKFSNVGAIGWALETHSYYSGYSFTNPSVDVYDSKILIGLTGENQFRFRGSSNTNYAYVESNGRDNAIVLELTNTGSMNSYDGYLIRSQKATIDDVAWVDRGNSNPDVVAPINHQARSDGLFSTYSDAPATTLERYSWSNGRPQSQQFWRMIGHTGTEDVIDIETLNSTATVMLGFTKQYMSQSLRFGDEAIGGNTSYADEEYSRLFLAVADSNGNWTNVDQIKAGKLNVNPSTNSYFHGKDPAAMAIGPNGTVWVAFWWSDWVEIPGLVSRNSGSGFMVASWSPTNGWMSADTIGFATNYFVNIDIAVDGNGDVFFSGACYGTVNMHGSSYSTGNWWGICFAHRHATNGWNAIHRSTNYNGNNPTMEAMTDHPNGGIVFWAKSGTFSTGTSTNGADQNVGGLIRLTPSNGTMWWAGPEPTYTNSYSLFVESIDTSPSGDIYVAGYFRYSVSFPNCCSVNSGGGYDGFIAKLNSSGVWDWSIALGGTSNDYIYDINMVGSGSIAVVGEKYGVISVGLTTLSSAGTGFVAMASSLGTWEWAAQPTGATTIRQVTATGNGTVAAVGQLQFSNSARTFGLDSLNSSDGDDIFLARMSADADADGITDNRDNCQQLYNPSQANFDADTQGDICDTDDDGEGIPDMADSCPMGALLWTSNTSTDYDTDGCKDDVEDTDDDNDGALDIDDMCAIGTLNWTSDGTTDYDTDGCKDSSEDLDDDDDTVNDTVDSCPKGELGWISTPQLDHDGDGCLDAIEDADDDNDGVDDMVDTCDRGDLNWTSSANTDNDGDGCLDATEDLNDDNDDFPDYDDSCPRGATEWYSGRMTDYDGDGCLDSTEDFDDDADGVDDIDDNCPTGIEGWVTNPTVDFDADGCHDWNEDTDDDGDGVSDLIDICSRTAAGAASNAEGCAPGQTPDSNGGGDSSVNYTEEQTYVNNTYVNNTYVNNTYENNTYSNETFQNQSFENNSYMNETFQNQTFQNNTNLNQTINEGDIVNETEPEENFEIPSKPDTEGALTWEPIAVIAMMVLLLLINFMHLVKKTPIPSGPPEEMLLMTSEMDAAFDQTDQVMIDESLEPEPSDDSNQHTTELDSVKESGDGPPLEIENTTKKEGFEWVEWPSGSGQNFYRPENTGGEWRKWPVE